MRNVVIASPLATQSGYGHHAREFIANAMELMSEEWDIKLVSMPWGHTPFTYPLPPHWQSKLIGLPLQSQPDIWVQITVPNEFQAVGKYNIGVTAGTEGDVCPKEWIESINKMQTVIVPSTFTKQTFETTAKQHGLTITCNLQVVSEYFREEVYNSEKVYAEVKEIDEIPESFCFLAVGHWLTGQLGEDRKNLSGLLHTFFDTYKNKQNNPALILKSSGATYSVTDRWEIKRKIRQIQDLFKNAKLPNVYLLHGDLSDDQMNALYNHSKVKAMVSFLKAEGFGRPLLEFATTGKPIIAPYYSGPTDFLNEEFICKLAGGLTPIHATAQNQFLIADAKWFTVDYKYAGKMFKEVQKNYKKWLGQAKRQRYHVNKHFTKQAVQQRYAEVFETIKTATASIPKQVELKLPKLDLPKLSLPKLQKVGE
jgi:glycosyltransferase involved in cell wall biosynthesis